MTPNWIAVDWGTTRLRAWAMRDAQPLGARSSDRGMSALTPTEFEPALLDLIADWLPATGRMRVVACGMVGARGGWAEASYRAIPCPPIDPRRATSIPTRDPRLDVRILPGLSQAEPPDVMRGEETQIAGFLAGHPDFEGALCLPGTHSKWVRLSRGRVERFRSFMTGEIFALLAGQSVLRLTIGTARPDPTAVVQAGAQALADPHAAQSGLFALRAAALLRGLAPEQAAGRLSGLLIGAELAAARDFWQDAPTVIVGAPDLARLYETLLLAAGARTCQKDASALVLAGLAAARLDLPEDT
ncbi:2-dehydro-3-deoxygalactonokinase [Paracoccus denitrificans]|uniref:2-keto-3-deoxygalactonate kinase n=1 Tax=Paracoccus denitrificans (strain Pd 1222) TaxID=318586 RepID=A1B5N8_PARDP|nr:2-dehydro-3-deoxygalactonokinase [Paracoccus denitrificans]ABL70832.1 2-keto-3-deoxygalactonate kinase [Paracoccus denitrificans PD1222]MBB4627632.1 2-dehydro-3-deoxygalactonokinase [Paracoccus denitrificans]MCU7429016.1 2-dehydro-3-deoxygalactonokinase [Paracoccus denitrificans]QAR26154.1 2-dehydro-3-deoxygalactonokinase [Paracoccus denitrificans]UPV95068.1 2-dehydro-3-deoxygalactonokinase [Paracoccus denitrificans]